MFSLAGQVALVTGAARGIGRSIAEVFIEAGASVTFVDIDEAALADARRAAGTNGATCEAIAADMTSAADVAGLVEAVVRQQGSLDAIVHAAGVWHGGTVLEVAEEEWDRLLTVNTKGLYLLAKYGQPALATTAGSITTIASIAGLKGTRSAGAYNASKAAVIALTKNLALDFAPYGIRANCICPGLVTTEMGEDVIRYRGGSDEVRSAITALHPIGRLGEPRDVAYAAVYLASREASWVTGTSLVVDGGCMAGY